MLNLVENHPELLQQIAADVHAEMATGTSQQDAMMAVMKKHEATLKGLLS